MNRREITGGEITGGNIRGGITVGGEITGEFTCFGIEDVIVLLIKFM